MKYILVVLCLLVATVTGNLTFYGNTIEERSTSGSDPSITPQGGRIWIDDPLNGDSWPGFGYLQFYQIYIHANQTTLPGLYLQIWTNTTMINNYTLKWQKLFNNYQTGKTYSIAPDPGQVVEVNQFDRIGFTTNGNTNPVALDFEVDDTLTASTAHRTYFRLLSRDNNVLPQIGDYKYVDNYALRGRYSIGIVLDNAPPRKPTEVYCGHDLIPRTRSSGLYYPNAAIDNSLTLVAGKITGFYFRLPKLSTLNAIQLQIWVKNTGSSNYTLVYSRTTYAGPGPEQTYNVSISDGPMVNSSYRVGWVAQYIFFSESTTPVLQFSTSTGPFQVESSYTFDTLLWNYEVSIGVIVDQQSINGRSQNDLQNEASKNRASQISLSQTAVLICLQITSLLVFHLIGKKC